MQSKQRLLFLIEWVTEFSGMLCLFTISRSLAEVEADLLEMGIVGGGISLLMAVSSLMAGRYSDRVGRRRVIVAGSGLLMLCYVGCALTGVDGYLRYVAYWLGGAALGMIYPPLYAWLSSSNHAGGWSQGVGRTVILFSITWNLGLICGQMTGGWLFERGQDWPMYLAIFLASSNLVFLAMVGPSPAVVDTGLPASGPPPDVAHRSLAATFAKLAWLANVGGAFSTSMIFHLLPNMAVELNVPPDQHGAILAVSRVVVIATYFAMHRWGFWRLRLGPAIASQMLAAVGMVVISSASGTVELLLGLIATAQLGGFNYFASLYYSTRGSHDGGRGTAAGMHEASLLAGFAAGSIFGGLAGRIGDTAAPYRLGAAVIMVMAVVQMTVYLSQVRPNRKALPTV